MTKQELLDMTKEMNQTKKDLDKRLEELNDAKKELDRTSNDFYKKIADNKEHAKEEVFRNVDMAIRAKQSDLPPVTKTLVLQMKELESKKKGLGTYLLLFIIYMGLFTAAVALFDISFELLPFWRYAIAVIIDLILSGVSVAVINRSKNKKIKEIKEDADVSQHLLEVMEIRKKATESYSKIGDVEKEAISKFNEQRDRDAKKIEKEIEKVRSQQKELEEYFLEVERQLFAIDNKNTIFIFGHDKYYEYEIYVNGLVFSEEPARELVKIKVNEGLVNIRVKANHYALANNHTSYKEFSRDCGVAQIESQETPVFLMLDGFGIEQMNMQEFFYRIENKKFKED